MNGLESLTKKKINEGNIMHVTKLNPNEMYELKDNLYSNFYYDMDALPELTEEQRSHIENADYPDDIDDEIIYEIYDDYDFVKDDFFCNER